MSGGAGVLCKNTLCPVDFKHGGRNIFSCCHEPTILIEFLMVWGKMWQKRHKWRRWGWHSQALRNIPSGKQTGRDTGFTAELAFSVEKAWLNGLREDIRWWGLWCRLYHFVDNLEVLIESFSCEHVFISDEDSITFLAYRSAFLRTQWDQRNRRLCLEDLSHNVVECLLKSQTGRPPWRILAQWQKSWFMGSSTSYIHVDFLKKSSEFFPRFWALNNNINQDLLYIIIYIISNNINI